MCGLSGLVSLNPLSPIQPGRLENLLDHLKLRGPDHQDSFLGHHIFLAHGRLSIQDTSSFSNQPLATNDSILVFNGEIYNVLDLKNKFNIPSDHIVSDTYALKWLLDNISIDSFISSVEGMFAFAYFNRKTSSLIVSRDRFAMKPFYYYLDNNIMVFGSDIKSIFLTASCFGFSIPLDINPLSFIELVDRGFVQELSSTVYSSICQLQPGTYSKFSLSNLSLNKLPCYKFSDFSHLILSERRHEFSSEHFLQLLSQSIHNHLVGDNPVSLAYSYGIDSSFILSRLVNNPKLKSLFFVSNESRLNSNSDQICSKNIVHSVYTPSNLLCSLKFFDNIGLFISDPATLLSAQIAKLTSLQGCKVVLTGDGGDELLMGYNRHKFYSRDFPPLFSQSLTNIFRLFSSLSKRCDRYSKLFTNYQSFSSSPSVFFSGFII